MNDFELVSEIPTRSASTSRSSSINRISQNTDDGDGEEHEVDHEHINLTENGVSNQVELEMYDLSDDSKKVNLTFYQQKKSLSQGMLDLALLSANANQLRYVLESLNTHPYSYFCLVFIILSIVFQIAVGVGLVLNTRYNIIIKDEAHKANSNNNNITIGILLITVINIIVPAFGVAS
ncbi:unnamed protein product [Diamesa hyperborea]